MQEDRSVKFLWLSQEDVIAADGLNMPETIRVVEMALGMEYRGEAIEVDSPSVRYEPTGQWRAGTHPAYIGPPVDMAGVKWIPADPANPRERNMPRATSLTILSRRVTGHPVALMDGTVPSAMRTAAVTGVGAKYLARKDAQIACLIGCGPINRLQIEAVKVAVPGIREVRVFDLWTERAQQFCQERQKALGIPFRATRNAREAIEGADIVVTATVGVTPETSYAEDAWVKPGAFFAEVSGNDAKPGVIINSDKVALDHLKRLNQTQRGVGRLYAAGQLPREKVSSLGEVINGAKPGRQNPRERIFQKASGLGIEDVVSAWRIYQVARQRGIGEELELWREPVWV